MEDLLFLRARSRATSRYFRDRPLDLLWDKESDFLRDIPGIHLELLFFETMESNLFLDVGKTILYDLEFTIEIIFSFTIRIILTINFTNNFYLYFYYYY